MHKGLKGVAIFAAIIIAALGLYFFGTFWSTGQFDKLHPHFAGRCDRLEGIPGAEDIDTDPKTGKIYVSSMDRRAWAVEATTQGAIYALSVAPNGTTATDLNAQSPDGFRPHGISIYRDNDVARLFVVNHPAADKSTVEIFDIADNGTLTHIRTINQPDELISANDIAAVGPEQFYATNDNGYAKGIMKTLTMYFRLPNASVVYFDGETMRKVADGLMMANGIATSADGDLVYVTETLGQKLQVYDRSAKTGDLFRIATIGIKSHLDNIHVANDNTAWIAAHPKLLDFLSHARSAKNNSPAQVFKVSFGTNTQTHVDEVYLNSGSAISGSSVAVPIGSKLIIGSVFEPHILICNIAK